VVCLPTCIEAGHESTRDKGEEGEGLTVHGEPAEASQGGVHRTGQLGQRRP
jgi:hypothetical protein